MATVAAALGTSSGVEMSSMAATCSVFAFKSVVRSTRIFMADQHIASAIFTPP